MPRTKETFESMREATRLKIETAALSLFARRGLSVKVGEIAKAAAVSQGLLYSHFPSKEALISELMRQATTTSSEAMTKIAGSGGTAAEKIRRTTDLMCYMFSEGPIGADYFMFVVQAQMCGFNAPDIAKYSPTRPAPVQSFAKIIAEGQLESSVVNGEPLQLSIFYWAAVQGLCCYAITGIPITPDPQMLNRILLKENFL